MSDHPRPVVAGNWKMHHGPGATRRFFENFAPRFEEPPPTLLVFPPALSLATARDHLPDEPRIELGVQNIHWEESGAYTGEVSAAMAVEAGASHVLVGHSERRHLFGETDAEVADKIRAGLRHELVPVVCVGETLDERREDRVDEVIAGQLGAALEPLSESEGARFMVAYEPVWAIGTGETASPEDASEAHATLRRSLVGELGERKAGAVPILYGGSVKPRNARELLTAPEVDGVLVGGASLDPDSFGRIATAL